MDGMLEIAIQLKQKYASFYPTNTSVATDISTAEGICVPATMEKVADRSAACTDRHPDPCDYRFCCVRSVSFEA